MADDPRTDEAIRAAREPWWAPSVRFLRFLLGALTLVGGLTWILVNLTGPDPLLDLAVGAVLSAGALVLLMPHRIRLPRPATMAAVIGGGLVGTVAGLLARTEQTCCSYAYLSDRGWPFHWVGRSAVATDPDTAYRLAQDADWKVNLISLSANLLLWAYAGMLVVVIAVLVRRNRSNHG